MCRKKRQRAKARAQAANERYEPTVVAPVREEWTTEAPRSAPSRQFGYACRILLKG